MGAKLSVVLIFTSLIDKAVVRLFKCVYWPFSLQFSEMTLCLLHFCLFFFFSLFYFFIFCFFLGLHPWNMEVPRLGVDCWPMPLPQPHQCQIRAVPVTYTTVHGNAGSLTHGARAGIKPATSWFLVGVISAAP